MKNKILFPAMILLLPFLEPGYFEQIKATYDIYNIWKVMSLSIILLLYVLVFRKISKIIIAIIIFQISLFISTLINQGDYLSYSASFVTIIGLSMLTELLIKYDFIVYCKSMLIPLAILVFVNLTTIFIFPLGFYTDALYGIRIYWFLGHYNRFIAFLLPMVYISLMESHLRNGRVNLKTSVLLSISVITIFAVWSATSVVCITLMVLFVLIIYNRTYYHVFNIINYSMITVTFILLFNIFRLQDKFAFIIENILKRNLTFSNRTLRWDAIIEYIKMKPFLGYGVETITERMIKTMSAGSVHNFFLETMYRGGIFALCLFVVIVYMASLKLYRQRDNQFSNILSFSIFVFFIRFLVESNLSNLHIVYALLVTAYHVDTIIAQHEKYKFETNLKSKYLFQTKMTTF